MSCTTPLALHSNGRPPRLIEGPRARCRRVIAMSKGISLDSWTQSPLQLAAFGPRLATGAVLSAREKLPLLEDKVQALISILQNPSTTWATKLVRFFTCNMCSSASGASTLLRSDEHDGVLQ
jgi:hypothetical protein